MALCQGLVSASISAILASPEFLLLLSAVLQAPLWHPLPEQAAIFVYAWTFPILSLHVNVAQVPTSHASLGSSFAPQCMCHDATGTPPQPVWRSPDRTLPLGIPEVYPWIYRPLKEAKKKKRRPLKEAKKKKIILLLHNRLTGCFTMWPKEPELLSWVMASGQ